MPQAHDPDRTAIIFRMVMPDHVCPYGVKAVELLERSGYEIEDHHLTSRDETEAFKSEHGVRSTPQIFIEGERIGGYNELQKHLGSRRQIAEH